MGLILHKIYENECRFEYEEINNEKAYDSLWEGIDLLNYDLLEAEIIFKELIKQYPFYIDAYNHLSIAFKYQNKFFESFITAEKSYNIGRTLILNNFNFKTDKLEYYDIKNRPYYRSCHNYALELQEAGKHHEAIKICDETQLLNKSDNLGLRYLSLESNFAINNLVGIRKLLKSNKDDWSIDFMYAKVNLEIISGNLEKAKLYLTNAIKDNTFLPDLIINFKKIAAAHGIKDDQFNFELVSRGSFEEAYEYWKGYQSFYKRKEILDFYKKYSKTLLF